MATENYVLHTKENCFKNPYHNQGDIVEVVSSGSSYKMYWDYDESLGNDDKILDLLLIQILYDNAVYHLHKY